MSRSTEAHYERHSKRRIRCKMCHLNVYWSHRTHKKLWECVWDFRWSHNSNILSEIIKEELRCNCATSEKCAEKTYSWCNVLLLLFQKSVPPPPTPPHRLIRLPCTVLTLCWMLVSVKSGSFHLWSTQSPGSHLLRHWGWDFHTVWTNRMGGDTDIWHEWSTVRLLGTNIKETNNGNITLYSFPCLLEC